MVDTITAILYMAIMIRVLLIILAFWVYFNDPSFRPLFIHATAFAIYERNWDIYKGTPIAKERIITFLDRNGNIIIELPLNAIREIRYVEKAL